MPCTMLQIQPTRIQAKRNCRMPKHKAVRLKSPPAHAETIVPTPDVKGIQLRMRHTIARVWSS